jgi:transcriptional regulator with XRE-family HTH domain
MMGNRSEGLDMPKSVKHRTPFAAQLVQLRKAKGLTQIELAESAGLSPRVVAHYETTIKGPTAGVVLRLSKALGVTPEQLMGQKLTSTKKIISRSAFKNAKMLDSLPPTEQKKVSLYIKDLAAKHRTGK